MIFLIFKTPDFKKLLCKIGLHKYEFTTRITRSGVMRKCVRCKKISKGFYYYN